MDAAAGLLARPHEADDISGAPFTVLENDAPTTVEAVRRWINDGIDEEDD